MSINISNSQGWHILNYYGFGSTALLVRECNGKIQACKVKSIGTGGLPLVRWRRTPWNIAERDELRTKMKRIGLTKSMASMKARITELERTNSKTIGQWFIDHDWHTIEEGIVSSPTLLREHKGKIEKFKTDWKFYWDCELSRLPKVHWVS